MSWSRYSLGGADASVHYHRYHIALLAGPAARNLDPLWPEVHDRWARYLARRGLPCEARP